MLRSVNIIFPNIKSIIKKNVLKIHRRNFLSQAYNCQEVWDNRLNSPLLQKVKLSELYYELDQTFQQRKNISAVDVDIFANTVNSEEQLGELQDLIYKLRLSAETSSTLDSTPHAVVRAFLKFDKYEELVQIINDRINYGIFLSSFDGNILMDLFVKKKHYGLAAKVGVQFMLQEDWEHQLTTNLALYSCFMYIQNPEGWPAEPEPEPEPKEEVKIRVHFIRNPYFDDHFDLTNPLHLTGKTLYMFGSKLADDCLSRSLQIIGLHCYEKKDELLKLIKKYKEDNKSIYKESLSLISDEDVLKAVDGIKMEDGDIEKELESRVKTAERICAERDIANQCKLYSEWENQRIDALEQQKQRLLRIQRLKDVEETLKDLDAREMKLWFFEKEHELDLEIERKQLEEQSQPQAADKSKKVDESYIPPEINKRRAV